MAEGRQAFDKARHIKYWQRCHKSLLPTAYTSSDSTRLLFAAFTICALDLLEAPITASERSSIRTWVLSLQHPEGGFSGSPAHAYAGTNAHKGHANLAATFFALVLLVAASEGEEEASAAFGGVDRTGLLRWLRRLQREDGSFGQNLWDGRPVGGSDMRHSYLASSIRWMLTGGKGLEGVEDLDLETMVAHVRRGLTYDGGLAESSLNESHGGYTYCGIAALALLDRDGHGSAIKDGAPRKDDMLKFLAYRQFSYLAKEEEDQSDENEENLIQQDLEHLSLTDDCPHVGYNGRWNKKADTCYCWWACGALKLLDQVAMIKMDPSRAYLLDITQHYIGGFSKTVGGPPDVYHSYLGLASLALMGKDGIKDFDVGLCCSQDITDKIVLAREGLDQAQSHSWAGDGFWEAINGAAS